MNEVLFFGFSTVADPKRKEILVPCQAPKNYKDPVLIREYVKKAEEERQSEVDSMPGIARLDSFCVQDREGSILIDDEGAPDAAGLFATWASENLALSAWDLCDRAACTRLSLGWRRGGPKDENPVPLDALVGFEMNNFLEVIRHQLGVTGNTGDARKMPTRFWTRNPMVVDPWNFFFPTDMRKSLNRPKAYSNLGVTIAAGLAAFQAADIARQLWSRLE